MEPAQISNQDSFDSEILLADTGYGQGQLLISPIQQITMYSVFPNQGKLVYPRLTIEDEKVKNDVISKNAANIVTEDLKSVVNDENGTAHNLASLNQSLAAKTGTAEIKDKQDEKGKENSFLYAFDPDHRNYSLVMFIEDHKEGQSAATQAPDLLKYLGEHYQ